MLLIIKLESSIISTVVQIVLALTLQKPKIVKSYVKEDKWHRRFGHLGMRSLQTLAKGKLVTGFDYDYSKEISFCQACVEGKLHKSQFPATGGKRAKQPLELVHSDVGGKIETSSLGEGHYFLTFIDDNTRYVWMYMHLKE